MTITAPPFMRSGAAREWKVTLEQARSLAAASRHATADSLLTNFGARYPGTAEGQESAYWRGVLRLDPANAGGTAANALPLLRSYVSFGRGQHQVEGAALLRVAEQIQALTKLAATAAAPATTTQTSGGTVARTDGRTETRPASDSAAQEAEIRRLRDELAKANAELERIRKRLVDPPKKPPPPVR